MALGIKTGGRELGVKNKRRPLLELIGENFPGYNPILAMCQIAVNPNSSPDFQFQAHKEISKYMYAQLKAIDVQIEAQESIQPLTFILPNGKTITY